MVTLPLFINQVLIEAQSFCSMAADRKARKGEEEGLSNSNLKSAFLTAQPTNGPSFIPSRSPSALLPTFFGGDFPY